MRQLISALFSVDLGLESPDGARITKGLLTCPLDAGCWLAPQPDLWPRHLHMAFLCGWLLGFLTAWGLGSKSKHSERESQAKAYCLF